MLMFYISKNKIKTRWEGKEKPRTENEWKKMNPIVFQINTATTLKRKKQKKE